MICRAAIGWLIATCVAGGPLASPSAGDAPTRACPAGTASDGQGDWIVAPSDNICGLRDARTLSNPSRIDFDAVLAATPEMERMRKENIDPSTPEGVRLRQNANDRVFRAADSVRASNGYCSVWKSIRHRDGRAVPDVTEAVKAKLRDAGA